MLITPLQRISPGLYLFVFCLLLPCDLSAGIKDTTVIRIRHSDGEVHVFRNGDSCKSCVQGSDILVAPSVIYINIEETVSSFYDYHVGHAAAGEAQTAAQPFVEATFGPYYKAVPDRDSIPGLFTFPQQRRLDTLRARMERFDTTLARMARRGESPDAEQNRRYDALKSDFQSLDSRWKDFSRLLQKHELFGVSLKAVDKLLYDNGGFLQIRTEALNALQKYYNKESVEIDARALYARLRSQLARDSLSLRTVAATMTTFNQLRNHLTYYMTLQERLADVIAQLPNRDRGLLDTVYARSLKAMNDFDRIVALAYDTEALAVAAISGTNTWQNKVPSRLSLSPGTLIPLTVRPKSNPHLKRMATLDPLAYTIHVGRAPVVAESDAFLRPGIGISFLFAPAALYSDYGVRQVQDGFEIVEYREAQDSRFTWGIGVGLSYSFLDWRADGGPVIWLPELTINPSNDVNALALGIGASFLDYLKIGVGLLWTKHRLPDGQQTGEIIGNALDLRLKDSFGGFGDGTLYISLSVFGWPSGLLAD